MIGKWVREVDIITIVTVLVYIVSLLFPFVLTVDGLFKINAHANATDFELTDLHDFIDTPCSQYSSNEIKSFPQKERINKGFT